MKRIAGFLLAALAIGGAVWAQGALSINGAGATFPYPMYSKWFDEYHKKNANLAINYQSIGSGGGIKQVTEGTVDFGATDAPMNDEQLKAYTDKHGSGILLTRWREFFWAKSPSGMIRPSPTPTKASSFPLRTLSSCTAPTAAEQPTAGQTTFQRSVTNGRPRLAKAVP
jgi:hypothetical protein